MKKLLFLILVAAAAWYGWKHWPDLVNKTPGHIVVIQNQSGKTMERIRFTADGQTQVHDELADGAEVSLPFKVANDSELQLVWEWKEALGEKHWQGGLAAKGPVVARHVLTIDGDGEVMYRAEAKGEPTQQ